MPMPEDIDGILQSVRAILLKGSVTQIIVQEGEPITFEREVSEDEEVQPLDSTEGFAELTPIEIVRNVTMEEFDLEEQGLLTALPHSILLWMIFLLEHEGWVPTHLIVSAASSFWKWLGVPARTGKRLEKFLGLRIEREEKLPNEVFLVGGSKHQGATIAEVGYILKGNVINVRANEESDRGGNHSQAGHTAIEAVAKSAG
jgi:hypothetical protein